MDHQSLIRHVTYWHDQWINGRQLDSSAIILYWQSPARKQRLYPKNAFPQFSSEIKHQSNCWLPHQPSLFCGVPAKSATRAWLLRLRSRCYWSDNEAAENIFPAQLWMEKIESGSKNEVVNGARNARRQRPRRDTHSMKSSNNLRVSRAGQGFERTTDGKRSLSNPAA